MPIGLALVAGGLASINPCGFSLLPALLSFYTGADNRRLPSAPSRVLQGLYVGAIVTAGFMLVFRGGRTADHTWCHTDHAGGAVGRSGHRWGTRYRRLAGRHRQANLTVAQTTCSIV
jgi:hypothetical protein